MSTTTIIHLSNGTTGSPAQRLHRGLDGRPQAREGRITPETLTAVTDAGNVAALVGMGGTLGADPARVRQLVAVAELAAPGVTVLPERDLASRSRRGLRLVVGAAVGLAAVAGLAAPAQAAVIPLTKPVVVTVSGPTAAVSLDVISTAPMFADGGHYVTLRDGALALGAHGYGGSEGGAAWVHIGARVPSRLLTPGTTTATLTDLGDGRASRVPVTVLRQSQVVIDSAVGFPGGVLVTGRALHYDVPSGVYRGDLASPVQVQVLVGVGPAARWKMVDTRTTTPDGGVFAVIGATPGRVQVRLVRPAGATVTGAASAVRMLTALPASTRGDLPGWTVA